MSYSICIKCERMVSLYQKYCESCVKKYNLPQDENWHKTHWFKNWDVERKEEFDKDLSRGKPYFEKELTPGEQIHPTGLKKWLKEKEKKRNQK